MTDIIPRTLLVIVDDSAEMNVALRYATWRSQQTEGRVAMLSVIEPSEIQPWGDVGDTMKKEAKKRIEQRLATFATRIKAVTRVPPLTFVKEGEKFAAVLSLLEERKDISGIVLGVNTESDPGPLVKYLTSRKGLKALKIPVMIVPDSYRAEMAGFEAVNFP